MPPDPKKQGTVQLTESVSIAGRDFAVDKVSLLFPICTRKFRKAIRSTNESRIETSPNGKGHEHAKNGCAIFNCRARKQELKFQLDSLANCAVCAIRARGESEKLDRPMMTPPDKRSRNL